MRSTRSTRGRPLILAEQLELPLFTASDEVASDRVEILRPW